MTAARAVPKAIIGALISVGAIVLFSSLALILAMPDIGAVVAGKVADPAAETITYHLGSSVARPLFALFIVSFMAAVVAAQTSCSRVIWANGRDGVLPASRLLSHLSGKSKLPRNAILVMAVISACILLLTFAQDAYATLLGFASIGYTLAFAFPTFGLFVNRLRGKWQPGVFSLGKTLGMVIVTIASAYVAFQIVNIAWPRDVGQAWYLRWAVVVMTALIAVAGVVLWSIFRKAIVESVDQEETGVATETVTAEPIAADTAPA